MTSNAKLAVLIDADNAQASIIKELLEEIATYGTASVKRAYGDWTTQNLKGWKDMLHMMAIQPIQQFSYTTGKNSTDSSLIIDAMDLLHAQQLDGFCLVSSDSDFTRLATRIREAGLVVYGFGEKKTTKAFVAACDKFIYTEILKPVIAPALASKSTSKDEPEKAAAVNLAETEEIFRKAITATAKDDGFAALAHVGALIIKNSPSFDPRNYGCQKLGELVRKLPFIDVKEVHGDKSPIVHLYVRLKQ